jgi:hypothetical protein
MQDPVIRKLAGTAAKIVIQVFTFLQKDPHTRGRNHKKIIDENAYESYIT